MQQDLMAKYQKVWSNFFTKPGDSDEAVTVLTGEQISQIKQAMESWHEKQTRERQQAEQQIFGEKIYVENIITALDKTGLFSRGELDLIANFYTHDSRHVSTDLHFIGLLCKDQHHPETGSTYNVDKQSQRQFEFQLQNFVLMANMSTYPEKWLYQLIVQRTRERLGAQVLTDSPELETKLERKRNTTDALNEIALPVALALQRRFIKGSYEIAINPQAGSEPKTSVIIIRTNLKSKEIPIDPAILTSLIYNLAKNAAKAIWAYKIDNPKDEKPYKIEIELNEDANGWSFVVADTGIGLETDSLLKQAGWAVERATSEELKIYENIAGKQAIRILQDWVSKNNSLRARNLKLGQVWDFAKLPRLSGFDKRGIRESSGFGLYGADYLAKNYGGDIVGANRFDQGAVFVIRIPKNQKVETKAA